MIHLQNPDPSSLVIGQRAPLRPRNQGRKWDARDDGDGEFQFPSQSKGQEFQGLWTLGTVGTVILTFYDARGKKR